MAQNVETQLLRKEHMILNTDRSVYKQFDSISQAKKWSREFQAKNGGLGCGVLAVIPVPPPKNIFFTVGSSALARDSSFSRERAKVTPKKHKPRSYQGGDDRVAGFQFIPKKHFPPSGARQ